MVAKYDVTALFSISEKISIRMKTMVILAYEDQLMAVGPDRNIN